MVAYLGGKARIGKKIWTAIREVENKWLDFHGQTTKLPYFEPFLGMGGVMIHFANDNDRKLYGCDIMPDIFEFWKAVTEQDWLPPPVEDCWTKENYIQLKTATSPSALRCFMGSVASHSCIFFVGFRKATDGQRDYYAQAIRKLEKWRIPMKRVTFLKSRSYHCFNPKGYLIYCDPPYRGCKIGTLWKDFDSDRFWDTMRVWSQHNLVIVSEKQAPPDFIALKTFGSHLRGTKYTESIFVHQEIAAKLKLDL